VAWLVDVVNDDVNTMQGVTYLLHRWCGLEVADAARLMVQVNDEGSAEVGRFDSQDEAELLVVRLATQGLHVTVRSA
jgi:ATP-dependent Clp protease adapter protein ClpS